MFTEITEDTISATDSCQMETTGTTLKVSPATQPIFEQRTGAGARKCRGGTTGY